LKAVTILFLPAAATDRSQQRVAWVISVKMDDIFRRSVGNIRISNQFLITCALHFAQPRCTTTPTVLSSKRNYHIGSQSII